VGEEAHPAGRRLGGYLNVRRDTVPRDRPNRATVECVAYPDSRGARRAVGNITTRSRSPWRI
jgi:hypothetical protein